MCNLTKKINLSRSKRWLAKEEIIVLRTYLDFENYQILKKYQEKVVENNKIQDEVNILKKLEEHKSFQHKNKMLKREHRVIAKAYCNTNNCNNIKKDLKNNMKRWFRKWDKSKMQRSQKKT